MKTVVRSVKNSVILRECLLSGWHSNIIIEGYIETPCTPVKDRDRGRDRDKGKEKKIVNAKPKKDDLAFSYFTGK